MLPRPMKPDFQLLNPPQKSACPRPKVVAIFETADSRYVHIGFDGCQLGLAILVDDLRPDTLQKVTVFHRAIGEIGTPVPTHLPYGQVWSCVDGAAFRPCKPWRVGRSCASDQLQCDFSGGVIVRLLRRLVLDISKRFAPEMPSQLHLALRLTEPIRAACRNGFQECWEIRSALPDASSMSIRSGPLRWIGM